MTVLLILAAAAVGIMCFLALRKTPRDTTVVEPLRQSQALGSLPSAAPAPVKPLSDVKLNPLARLSFEDSLTPSTFAERVKENVEAGLLASARSSGCDVINGSLQIGSLSQGGYVVTFGGSTSEFVTAADGSVKAVTREGGGRFGEIGTIDTAATWMNRLSQTTAIIVTVAHIISGADLSKRLAKVEGKVSQILAYRKCDQYGDLQTTYEELQRALGEAWPQLEEVKRLRERIRNLRNVLFLEIGNDLNLPPLRPEAWIGKRKWDAWVTKEGKGKHNERVSQLDAIYAKAELGTYCLRLEALATAFVGDVGFQKELVAHAGNRLFQIAERLAPLEAELRQDGQPQTWRVAQLNHLASAFSSHGQAKGVQKSDEQPPELGVNA